MSDFFSGVYGARFPDVVINGGGNPLPGMGGLPTPLHDTPDAKINYNSSLLGDLEPYAYGEPAYLSTQTSYLNIPHKIQKIVPGLYLPEPDGTGNFQLNHPIDDGDVSFVMRLDRNSEVCADLSNRSVHRSGLGTAIDPMINLCTLNYLLAGIQICTQLDETRAKWDQLLHYLDKRRFSGAARAYTYADLKHIVRHLVKPFGIAHGSEKQGGQHEGSLSPVTWPVSFVISLTLDGKEANMVNIWHKHDVEAGADLVLRLKPVPLPHKYTLNHYHKNLAVKQFSPNLLEQIRRLPPGRGHDIGHVWQLVPDVFELSVDDYYQNLRMPRGFETQGVSPYWQQEGFWHIAKAQVHCKKYGNEEFYFNDMANNLRTGHLDVTFQPSFYAVPHRVLGRQNQPATQTGRTPNVRNFLGEGLDPTLEYMDDDGGGHGPSRMDLGDGNDAGLASQEGVWSSSLNLEKRFEEQPTKRVRFESYNGSGSNNTGATLNSGANYSLSVGLRGSITGDNGAPQAVLRPMTDADFQASMGRRPVPLFQQAGPHILARDAGDAGDAHDAPNLRPQDRAWVEDCMRLINAGGDSSQPPQQAVGSTTIASGQSSVGETAVGVGESALASGAGGAGSVSGAASLVSSLFSAPKPGLKATKRPPARGKGVMGAVLSSDGSVTHEPSRIL